MTKHTQPDALSHGTCSFSTKIFVHLYRWSLINITQKGKLNQNREIIYAQRLTIIIRNSNWDLTIGTKCDAIERHWQCQRCCESLHFFIYLIIANSDVNRCTSRSNFKSHNTSNYIKISINACLKISWNTKTTN